MISKIKTGIISGFGLIIFNIIIGIILIPCLKLSNTLIQLTLLQIPIFYFTLSMWLSLRFVLINYFKLLELKKTLDWLISTMALSISLSTLYIFIASKELFYVNIVVSIILFINYLMLFKGIYEMDKHDLKYIGDLHNYLLSILLTVMVSFVIYLLNYLFWHKNIKFIDYFINGVPILFIIVFFKHVKQDNQVSENASA